MNLNNYKNNDFKIKHHITLANLEIQKISTGKVCLVFDFDNCLINLMKIQLEIYHTEQLPDNLLSKFLDEYTIKAEPIESTWNIIYKNQKSTIIILSGNKYENILKWLVLYNRDKLINNIISVGPTDVAFKKFKEIKLLSEIYDRVIFYDDSIENLVINAGLKNVELMKVTPKIT